MIEDEKIEKLANYAHKTWVGWMEHLFELSVLNNNGEAVIPKGLVERWNRQIETLYKHLSENEKESDRKEAREMLAIIGEHPICETCKHVIDDRETLPMCEKLSGNLDDLDFYCKYHEVKNEKTT